MDKKEIMFKESDIVVNAENDWRLEAPEPRGWARDVTHDSVNKYFMVSVDSHLTHPRDLFVQRMDKKWHDLLPRIEIREGRKFMVVSGARPEPLVDLEYEGEDGLRTRAGASTDPRGVKTTLGADRIAEQAYDGVDAELTFPNGAALLIFASGNLDFINAQCQVWNDWAWEVSEEHTDYSQPAAAICTADVDVAIAEIERVAKMGYRVVHLPCKPVFGPPNVADINYNLPVFDPMWAAIQDHDLAIVYHVSTGRDPRAARGNGAAIISYVCHSLAPTIEPIVNMCSSGVFERFPRLRAATIEADAGWVPWMLQKMDEGYRKHHFWVRPKMKELPSQYYRNNCFASFGEDRAAVLMVEEFGLQDNFMWANDFPHHEGSWPHSTQAIYRTFGDDLQEDTRAKLLGLNAARCFKFPIPTKYRD